MPAISEQPGDPEIIFFDDFISTSLDRSSWNVEITGPVYNNEQQAYVDSPETIYIDPAHNAEGNGFLVIHPRHCPGFVTPEGNKFDFISGRLNTMGKVEFMYGSIAARMKLMPRPGLWPAFWSMGSETENPWPKNGEIDIMENVGDPTWTNVAMHGPGYSGDTPLVSRKHFAPDNDANAWHIYSVDWTKDFLVFKTDGEETYRVTRAMVQQYGPWTFDNSKFILLNFALGGVYPVAVNKIESPYLGLSESAVQLIKENRAKLLIDWVRVTRLED